MQSRQDSPGTERKWFQRGSSVFGEEVGVVLEKSTEWRKKE